MRKSSIAEQSEALALQERIENSLRFPLSKNTCGFISTNNLKVFFPGRESRTAAAYAQAQTDASLSNDLKEIIPTLLERNLDLQITFFKALHPNLLRGFGREGSKRVVMTLTPEDFVVPAEHHTGSYIRLNAGTELGKMYDYVNSYDLAYNNEPSLHNRAQAVATTKMIAEQDDVFMSALELDDKIVSGALTSVPSEDRGVCGLYNVFTVPTKRRQGLALELCQHMLADRFAAGAELVWCECDTLAAATFCAQLGFKRVGVMMVYMLHSFVTNPSAFSKQVLRARA